MLFNYFLRSVCCWHFGRRSVEYQVPEACLPVVIAVKSCKQRDSDIIAVSLFARFDVALYSLYIIYFI